MSPPRALRGAGDCQSSWPYLRSQFRTVEGLRIVKSGLHAGDRVIVAGLQKVFMPGMPVTAQQVAMRATAAH